MTIHLYSVMATETGSPVMPFSFKKMAKIASYYGEHANQGTVFLGVESLYYPQLEDTNPSEEDEFGFIVRSQLDKRSSKVVQVSGVMGRKKNQLISCQEWQNEQIILITVDVGRHPNFNYRKMEQAEVLFERKFRQDDGQWSLFLMVRFLHEDSSVTVGGKDTEGNLTMDEFSLKGHAFRSVVRETPKSSRSTEVKAYSDEPFLEEIGYQRDSRRNAEEERLKQVLRYFSEEREKQGLSPLHLNGKGFHIGDEGGVYPYSEWEVRNIRTRTQKEIMTKTNRERFDALMTKLELEEKLQRLRRPYDRYTDYFLVKVDAETNRYFDYNEKGAIELCSLVDELQQQLDYERGRERFLNGCHALMQRINAAEETMSVESREDNHHH